MSTASYQARRTIKEEKKAGTLINASGRDSTKSAVFLDNGTVISSPLTVTRLLSAIEKANHKQPNPKRVNESQTIHVYDAIIDESDIVEEITEENLEEEDAENDSEQ